MSYGHGGFGDDFKIKAELVNGTCPTYAHNVVFISLFACPKKIPKTSDSETNFNVIKVAFNNFGKLEIIKSKSINTPFDSEILICLKPSC